ncbi:MAG: TIGR02996 domain-containing protein [Thermogemmata sp.]|nr:TIGR02996 domain-containing protein [Thermogemmata sp.]
MDEHALFRQQVWRNPDDDVPFLIYADWLEERGQRHEAEFLRLECRLRQAAPEDPELVDMLHRRVELCLSLPSRWLDTHCRYTDSNFWFADWFNHLSYPSPTSCLFHYCCHAVAGQRHAQQILSRALYRALVLMSGRTPHSFRALPEIPELSDFDMLQLQLLPTQSGSMRGIQGLLRTLSQLTTPTRWKCLGLQCNQLLPALVDLVTELPAYQGIRHFNLSVSGHVLDNEELGAWQRLCQSNWFGRLCGLYLHLDYSSPQWELLLNGGPFPQIRWLDISNHSNNRGISLSLLERLFPNLVCLRLSCSHLIVDTSALPPGLRYLELSLDHNSESVLAQCQEKLPMDQLYGIRLHINDSSSSVLAQFLKHLSGTCLRYLRLRGPAVDSARLLQTLGSIPQGQHLGYLAVSSSSWREQSELAPATVDRLLRRWKMPQLRHLTLGGFSLPDSIGDVLASDRFPQLRLVDLQNCEIEADAKPRNKPAATAASGPYPYIILWPTQVNKRGS